MSELVQPVLFMQDTDGVGYAVKLQIDLTRDEAETEAAYYLHTAPPEIAIERATVVMLAADMADAGIDAWAAGLPVHSLDCDCDLED